MKLHKYENYDEYVKEQTQANVAKLKNVWVRENAIQKVVSYKPFASSILCHGTRNCLLYTSPSPRDRIRSRMPSSA